MELILASASPRRRELIKSFGLQVEVIPSDVDEDIEICDAQSYVKKLAFIKAENVYKKIKKLTLGADTIVEIDGEILGKPKTFEAADKMFRKLCGKTHRVLTGFCLIWNDGVVVDCDITYVKFKPYDSVLVKRYIDSGSPYDKAGGYGIQDEQLSPLIDSVSGSLNNVIGLPTEK